MSVPAKLWKWQFAWMHFSRVNFLLIQGKHWNPRRVSNKIHFSIRKWKACVPLWPAVSRAQPLARGRAALSSGWGLEGRSLLEELVQHRVLCCVAPVAQDSWGLGCHAGLQGSAGARSPWGVEGASVVSKVHSCCTRGSPGLNCAGAFGFLTSSSLTYTSVSSLRTNSWFLVLFFSSNKSPTGWDLDSLLRVAIRGVSPGTVGRGLMPAYPQQECQPSVLLAMHCCASPSSCWDQSQPFLVCHRSTFIRCLWFDNTAIQDI